MTFNARIFIAMMGLMLPIGCASTKLRPHVLTPTELRTSADLFDGKEVTVIAWMTLESEDANLWTDARDMKTGRTIHCVSLENFDEIALQKKHFNRRRVEVTGLFRKDVVLDSGTIRFAACSRAAIEPKLVRRL